MNEASTTGTRTLTLSIEGMSCGHCVQAVTEALAGLSSGRVRSVAVGSAELEVLHPDAAIDAIAALEDAGYTARVAEPSAPSSSAARGRGGCCGGPKGCCG